MTRNTSLLSVLFLIMFCGCKQDTTEPKPIYQVPDAVEVYIQRFREEARLRGQEIRIENLIVEFGKVSGDDVCGECRLALQNPSHQKRIILSASKTCWEEANDLAREELVFHELGHCVLNRIQHKTSLLPNGNYASIMNGNTIGLYQPCLYDLGGTNDNQCDERYKRQYYLDELFNENTPTPAWGK